jgi:hypothetical protein
MRPCMCTRVLTRLKCWGWSLRPTFLCGVDEYLQRTCRVLGEVAWRKRRGNLTDEVPRRSPSRDVDKHCYKAIAERECEAAESAGRSLALAPWGLQRVWRRSPGFFFQGPKGHTDERGWMSRLARVQ